jgi:hypothetical protein
MSHVPNVQSPQHEPRSLSRFRFVATFLLLAARLADPCPGWTQDQPAGNEPATGQSPAPSESQPQTPPQTPQTPPATPETRLTLESASNRVKAVEALEGQEELKARLLPLLRQTETFLKEEEALARQAELFRFDPQKLETPPPSEPEGVERNREEDVRAREDLATLRTEREVLSQTLVEKSNQLKAIDAWEQTRLQRLEAIPRELNEVRQKLDSLQQPPQPPENEPQEAIQARRNLWRAEVQLNQQRQSSLQLEQKYYSSEIVTQRKTQEKTAIRRDMDRIGRLIEVYRKRIQELDIQAARTLERRIELIQNNVSVPLKPRVEQIRERSSVRTGSGGLLNRAQILQRQLDASELRLQTLNDHREATERYLE